MGISERVDTYTLRRKSHRQVEGTLLWALRYWLNRLPTLWRQLKWLPTVLPWWLPRLRWGVEPRRISHAISLGRHRSMVRRARYIYLSRLSPKCRPKLFKFRYHGVG